MKKNLLFDFDGVIADSYSLAFETNKTIFPNQTDEDYKKRFEGNIYEGVSKLEKEAGKKEDTILEFFTYYSERMNERVIPFDGIKHFLEEIHKTYNLFIISSSENGLIEGFLEKEKMLHFFKKIYGGDVHFSKKVKIQMVFDEYNISSQECLFVTDTLGDIREAQDKNVEAVAVAWGFHEEDTLKRGDPVAITHSVKELEMCITNFFNHNI